MKPGIVAPLVLFCLTSLVTSVAHAQIDFDIPTQEEVEFLDAADDLQRALEFVKLDQCIQTNLPRPPADCWLIVFTNARPPEHQFLQFRDTLFAMLPAPWGHTERTVYLETSVPDLDADPTGQTPFDLALILRYGNGEDVNGSEMVFDGSQFTAGRAIIIVVGRSGDGDGGAAKVTNITSGEIGIAFGGRAQQSGDGPYLGGQAEAYGVSGAAFGGSGGGERAGGNGGDAIVESTVCGRYALGGKAASGADNSGNGGAATVTTPAENAWAVGGDGGTTDRARGGDGGDATVVGGPRSVALSGTCHGLGAAGRAEATAEQACAIGGFGGDSGRGGWAGVHGERAHAVAGASGRRHPTQGHAGGEASADGIDAIAEGGFGGLVVRGFGGPGGDAIGTGIDVEAKGGLGGFAIRGRSGDGGDADSRGGTAFGGIAGMVGEGDGGDGGDAFAEGEEATATGGAGAGSSRALRGGNGGDAEAIARLEAKATGGVAGNGVLRSGDGGDAQAESAEAGAYAEGGESPNDPGARLAFSGGRGGRAQARGDNSAIAIGGQGGYGHRKGGKGGKAVAEATFAAAAGGNGGDSREHPGKGGKARARGQYEDATDGADGNLIV